MNNTSGQVQFGLESSTGGSLISGSAAYSSYIGTNAGFTAPFYITTNGVIRQTINGSTGAATFASSQADTSGITGALNVTNNTSGCVFNATLLNSSTSNAIFFRGQTVRAGADDQYFFAGQTGNGSSITTNKVLITTNGAATFSSSVDATIFNSTSNAFRFSGSNALSLVTLNSQSVVKINAAGYWGTQLVGANDKGILIDNTGNVGIGTTSPQLKLDIQTGSLGAYHNTTSSNGAQIYLGDMNFAGGAYATSAPGIGAAYNSGQGVAGDLAFYIYASTASSRNEAMRIKGGTGNVLIGTTTDAGTGKLQVNGTVHGLSVLRLSDEINYGITITGVNSGNTIYSDGGQYLKLGGNGGVALTFGATNDTATFTSLGTGLVKSSSGTLANATSGTDYQAPITLTTTGTSGVATFISNVLNIPNYGSALSGYVPYTGATADVNLGTRALLAGNILASGSLSASLSSATSGVLNITNTGAGRIADFQNSGALVAYITNAGSIYGSSFIKSGGSSSQFLKADGSVDSSSYVPYTGASSNLDMGGYTVTASAFYESSDIRFKNVLETNPNISAIGIDVIKFTRNGSDTIRYGYSAQQVQSIVPDAVFGDNELVVNYMDVHTLKIASLENRVAELELRLKSTI